VSVVCCKVDGRGGGGRNRGAHSPGHNLNIIEGFTDGFSQRVHFVSHFVYINDTSWYLLAFLISSIIPLENIKGIFLLEFTDGYNEWLFCR
jgi:hypothetical protein